MKYALIYLFYTFPLIVFAQKRVTNFRNDSTQTPNSLSYLGTLNSKVFFTAFTPENGNEIWVSDGTNTETQILKDINEGEVGIYPNSFVVNGSRAYFLVDGNIWKTDGTSENTNEVIKTDKRESAYFLQLAIVDNKLLAVYHDYVKRISDFYWLTELGKLVKWEQQVTGFSIHGNSLFFIKNTGNDSTPTYTLYHYLQSPKEIYSTKSLITHLAQFENETDIFCSITSGYDSGLKRNLIKINKKQVLKNQILDWGNHQHFVPQYLENEEGEFLLVKANSFSGIDSLFLYKTTANNLILHKKMGGKAINSSFSYVGGGERFLSNTILKNDKLFFINGFTTEGANVFFCNFFDFVNNTSKQTSTFHVQSYQSLKVNMLNDSLYKISTDYISFLYNSKSNIIFEKTSKLPDDKKVFFELKNQTFELSDNIYKVLVNERIPLIPNRKIYKVNSSGNVLTNQLYKGKQYFLFNNSIQRKCELWVMDTLNARRVEINDGYCGSFLEVKNLSDKLFYEIWDGSSLKLDVYQIDGVTNSSSLAYSFKSLSGNTPNIGFSNDNYIAVSYYNNKFVFIFKDKIEEIPMNEGSPIYTDKNIYFIKSNNTSRTLSKLENGKLKFILQTSGFGDYFVSENRIYFKNGQQLNYLDENENLVTIADKVDYFNKSNNHLVYREYISNKNYLYNVIDLKNNKTISKIQTKTGLYHHFENNKGFYFINYSSDTPARIGIFDGKDTYDIFSANVNIGVPTFYKEGILYQYNSNINQSPNVLVYYDFIKKKHISILNNSRPFSIKVNEKSDFVLIDTFLENNQRMYQTWGYKNKSLKSVSTEKGEIFNYNLPAGNYTTSSYTNYYGTFPSVWSFKNDSLVRQEPTPKTINEVKLEDIVSYQTKFLVEQGNELFAIGDGFSINFDEIVKGTEGILLSNTFIFNNQLFVFAFTYSNGWQVWKMEGSSKALPLSKEEGLEELINIFPIPVEDLINIEANKQFDYRIINSIGQEVMKGKLIHQQPINLENLAQGLYIIQFYDKNNTFSKKIVKH